MIDVLDEDILSLKAACKEKVFRHPETGKPAHISAMYRLTTRGARDVDGQWVRLETVKLPRGLATSREAIQRFIHRLTKPESANEQPQLTPAAVRREQLATDRELDALGI